MSNGYYFGYGSNANLAELSKRCQRYGKIGDLLKPVTVAYLPDMELAFNYFSTVRNGGALNVMPRRGSVVAGVVFEVTEVGWEMLDQKEGAPYCYERKQRVVLTEDGRELPVTLYEVTRESLCEFTRPTEEYLNVVITGFQEFGLDAVALRAAAENRPQTPLDGLFVYGTLLRGEMRAPLIAEDQIDAVLITRAPGQLLKIADYPGMVLANAPDQWVEGEYLRVKNIIPLLNSLDSVEGFVNFGSPQSLFRRAIITVDVGEPQLRRVWTYLYNNPSEEHSLIPSGDWRSYRGIKDQFWKLLAANYCRNDEAEAARKIAESNSELPGENIDEMVKKILPIADALKNGIISEKELAQATGRLALRLQYQEV
jgi:gamma-glutamylcyclotransferase (GGCT)/AIG2-like uncharacterized protein YtfP